MKKNFNLNDKSFKFDDVSEGDEVLIPITKNIKVLHKGEHFRVGPLTGNCSEVTNTEVIMKVTGHSSKGVV